MRKMLTEVLLSVTNDELHNIAKEAYNDALIGTCTINATLFLLGFYIAMLLYLVENF